MRVTQIDMLKGISVISVIILYTLPSKALLSSLSPYHIWQAVPIFIILSGYTVSLSYLNKEIVNLKDCYESSLLFHRFDRLLKPFIFIWLIQMIYFWEIGIQVHNWILGGFTLSHIFNLPLLIIIFVALKYFALIIFNITFCVSSGYAFANSNILLKNTVKFLNNFLNFYTS